MKPLVGAALFVSSITGACSSAPPTTAPEYEPAELAPPAEPTAAMPESAPTASATASASPAPAAATATALPEPAAAAPLPLSVEGANLNVGSITADGFTMKDLGCKLDGGGGLGGLLLGPTIAAGLSKKKSALDACAPKGADVRVRFTAAGGKIASAEAASGDAKVDACVVKVLKTVPGIADGTCAATVHAGK